VRTSSIAISFNRSSLISLSKSFKAKALMCGLAFLAHTSACPGSYFVSAMVIKVVSLSVVS
jgi:hypothetical protein